MSSTSRALTCRMSLFRSHCTRYHSPARRRPPSSADITPRGAPTIMMHRTQLLLLIVLFCTLLPVTHSSRLHPSTTAATLDPGCDDWLQVDDAIAFTEPDDAFSSGSLLEAASRLPHHKLKTKQTAAEQTKRKEREKGQTRYDDKRRVCIVCCTLSSYLSSACAPLRQPTAL
jgi:hypothetical protein